MRTALKVSTMALLGSGALLLVLGLIIWTERGPHEQFVAVHIALGSVLILSLWTICAIAARSGVPSRLVAIAAAWGVVVVVLGLSQEDLVQGDRHWTIQVLHVAVSMGAIAWGRRLVGMIRRVQFARGPGPQSRATVPSTVGR